MTALELMALASAAYGRGWQSRLARDLGCHRVTVAQWAAGRRRISPATAYAIRAACASVNLSKAQGFSYFPT